MTYNYQMRIEGVSIDYSQPHFDSRGQFSELFRKSKTPIKPQQINLSESNGNVFRGMHYHKTQTDVWIPISGSAELILKDLRYKSETYFNIHCTKIYPGSVITIPPGVAHGFYCEREYKMLYVVDVEYDGSQEYGFNISSLKGEIPDELLAHTFTSIKSKRDTEARDLVSY